MRDFILLVNLMGLCIRVVMGDVGGSVVAEPYIRVCAMRYSCVQTLTQGYDCDWD